MLRYLLTWLLGCAGLCTSFSSRGQGWQWAAGQGSSTAGPVDVKSVALDAAGNTVVGGSFQGTITLGSFTLTSAGGTDGIVARLSPTGQWLQAERLGGSAYDTGVTNVAVGTNGTVWVVGSFGSTVTLGNTALGGGFLASLTTTGQWQNVAPYPGGTLIRLLPEANGDVVLAGHYWSASYFGSIPLPSTAIQSVFVARYRPGTGWYQAGSNADTGQYIYLDEATLAPNGDVVLAGNLFTPANLSLTFGTQTATISTSGGNYGKALYVARFSSAGTWTQLTCASAGTGDSYGVAMTLDVNGDVVVAANLTAFRGTFGSLTLQNPVPTGNSPLPYLARLSPAGIWTQVQGGIGPGKASVLLHPDGSYLSPYGAGFINATATGVITHRLTMSSPYGLTRNSYAVSPTGRVVAAGTFYYPSATFGSLTLTTNDQQAAFVASASGLLLGTQPATGTGSLTLFPNPSHTTTTLRLPAPTSEVLPLLLRDALGRTVRQQVLPTQTSEAVLDLTGLPPGLYLVRAGTHSRKLVIE